MAKTGRPPIDAASSEPSAYVHLTLSARDYDDLTKKARAQRQSVQDVIRAGVSQLLRRPSN